MGRGFSVSALAEPDQCRLASLWTESAINCEPMSATDDGAEHVRGQMAEDMGELGRGERDDCVRAKCSTYGFFERVGVPAARKVDCHDRYFCKKQGVANLDGGTAQRGFEARAHHRIDEQVRLIKVLREIGRVAFIVFVHHFNDSCSRRFLEFGHGVERFAMHVLLWTGHQYANADAFAGKNARRDHAVAAVVARAA